MWQSSALRCYLRRLPRGGVVRLPTTPVPRRTYMDVHQRPSHSGMFKRDGTPEPPPAIAPGGGEEEESSFSLYVLLFTRAAMAAGIIYSFTEYVCDITLCEGPSMSPTLKPSGEIVLIDKWTLRRKGVADGCRGTERLRVALERQAAHSDAAVWHERRISVSDLDPPTWKDWYTLLSTPLSIGDVVVVEHPSRKGTVCKRVAGLPGDTVLTGQRSGLLVIPDGHVWLEGDNPINSADSRTYGTVPLALVQGRVLFRVWPLRGSALLQRGAPPRQEATGFTILPAGYQGEQIIKHRESKMNK